MTEHPYRAGLVRVERRVALSEAEPPPRGVRVRAWSDGTTRLRIGSARSPFERLLPWGGAAAFGAAAVAPPLDQCDGPFGRAAALIAAVVLAGRAWRSAIGEHVVVTPAALSWRRWLRGRRVFALAEISTVVVAGSGDEAHLVLQVGRERVPLADGLGYDEASLRWIAQRLRRAVEAAR